MTGPPVGFPPPQAGTTLCAAECSVARRRVNTSFLPGAGGVYFPCRLPTPPDPSTPGSLPMPPCLRLLAPLAAGLALTALLPTPEAPAQAKGARHVHFCFWNVENLFDDRDNPKLSKVDRAFDRWFATDPQALKQKLMKVGDVLQEMNDGRGPDIIALAEVESLRAAELVMQELNRRLRSRKQLHYHTAVYRDPKG